MKLSVGGAVRRTVLTAALAATAFVFAAGAADDGRPATGGRRMQGMTPEMQAQRLEGLAKALSLTDEQKTSVGKIFQEQESRMKQIMEDSAMTGDQKRTAHRQTMEWTDGEIKKVLTADQQKKYAEMQERMRRNAPDGGPGGPPPGQGGQLGPRQQGGQLDAMTRELGLSDEQKTRFGAVLEKQAAKMREMQEFRKKTDEEIAAILTPEQKKKYEEMQNRWRERARERGPEEGRRPEGEKRPPAGAPL